MSIVIPQEVINVINYTATIIGNNTNNWLVVKFKLISFLPKEYRKNFSKRHKTTKKQIINDFDKAIINYWKTITGVDLIIPPEKIHDLNWHSNEKGWGLKLFNEHRTNANNKK